jgi:hypothetical protein
VAVFAVVLAVSWASVLTRRQLGAFGGVTDEYFPLSAKLLINHTLGPASDEPSTLRPPGYPAFGAAVLAVAAPAPARTRAEDFTRKGQRAIQLAQGVVLAATCGLLCGWLGRRVDPRIAAAAGLTLGLNPFSLVMVGLLHYGIVHLATLVVGVVVTDRERDDAGRVRSVFAGLAWGLASLVRPVTLLLPATLALSFLVRRQGPVRRALLWCAGVAVGMAVVLAPWAVRNYRLTGRLVAVADNAWPTLWAQAALDVPFDPNHYSWFDVYTTGFQDVFRSATGQPGYDYLVHTRRIFEVETAYRDDTLRHLRQHPATYARNVARAAAGLLTAEPLVMLAAFRALQDEGHAPHAPDAGAVPQTWLLRGRDQPQLPRPAALSVRGLMLALEVAALGGLVAGVARPRAWGAGTLAGFLCVMGTHALVFVHLMHYYLRLPFLVIFAADLLDRLGGATGRLRGAGVGLAVALAAGSAAASAFTLFF